jgi:hypothetical protein
MFVICKEMEDRFALKKAEFATEKDKLSLELKNSLSAMEAKFVTENDRLSRELRQSFEEERGNLDEQSQFYVKMVGELHHKLCTTEVARAMWLLQSRTLVVASHLESNLFHNARHGRMIERLQNNRRNVIHCSKLWTKQKWICSRH